jgi:hypothetical protein
LDKREKHWLVKNNFCRETKKPKTIEISTAYLNGLKAYCLPVKSKSRWLAGQRAKFWDLVPILPKVTFIWLQIYVTCSFYIFVTFYQHSLVGHIFSHSFCANLLKNTCKIGKIRLTNIQQNLVEFIFLQISKKIYTHLWENLTNMCKIGKIVFGRIGSWYMPVLAMVCNRFHFFGGGVTIAFFGWASELVQQKP